MTNEKSEPTIGVFKTNEALQIMPFPNGGWTIVQAQSRGEIPRELGAYSTAKDMLSALSKALT